MTPVTLSDLVTVVTNAISASAIYTIFENIMPFIGSMVLVVLGLTVLRRCVKGIAKLRIRF